MATRHAHGLKIGRQFSLLLACARLEWVHRDSRGALFYGVGLIIGLGLGLIIGVIKPLLHVNL